LGELLKSKKKDKPLENRALPGVARDGDSGKPRRERMPQRAKKEGLSAKKKRSNKLVCCEHSEGINVGSIRKKSGEGITSPLTIERKSHNMKRKHQREKGN